MQHYDDFYGSLTARKKLKKEIKIDDLVREAKADITKTEEKTDLFFKWLIPSLLLTATLIIIIYKKKLLNQPSQN
jgi:hypothetical protein